MHEAILHPEVQQFIRENENEDERKLLLKYSSLFQIPFSIIANQIAGRRKAKIKLPTYYNTPGIIYPAGVSIEQSSSEITARFKANSMVELNPDQRDSIADLTGGFGVDTLYFSRHFRKVFFIEPNPDLLSISQHNFEQLGCKNIEFHNVTAEEFLRNTHSKFAWIYLDPSRRSGGNKTFKLRESSPDVAGMLNALLKTSSHVLIKTSPLMDISLGMAELQNVSSVLIVSVENECREILFHCIADNRSLPVISAIDLKATTFTSFSFSPDEEQYADVQYAEPGIYLYEPNASVLKAGAFKSIARRFNIYKIHPNTHLYTSGKLLWDFPGRIFKVEQHVKPDAKILKTFLPEMKANVVTRNYPLSPDELKRKVKLKDGGEKFLIAFTGMTKRNVVIASRVSEKS